MLRAAVLLPLLVACGEAPAPPRAPAIQVPQPTKIEHGIGWFDDAIDAAFAAARATDKPVFLDLWAGWCTPCRQMRATVITADKLPVEKDQFVFLAVDTERDANAAFVTRYPTVGLPTFYVIDPDSGAVLARQLGSAPLGQFRRFLHGGTQAHALARAKGTADPALRAFADGDAAMAAQRYDDAAAAFARARAAAPATWPRRLDSLALQGDALARAGKPAACTELLIPELAHVRDNDAFQLGLAAMMCAWQIADEPVQRAALAAGERALEPLCTGEGPPVAPDDRATACAFRMGARATFGDKPGERAAGERRLAHIAAATAGYPHAIAVMDDEIWIHTLIALGRTAEAEATLRARAAALPDDYLPPSNLAMVYENLERWDDALAQLALALDKAHGAFKVKLLGRRAEVYVKTKRADDARRTLDEQLAAYDALPAAQQKPGKREAIVKRRAELN